MTAKPDKDFWHKRYHGRAIKGYMGLSLEQRGAYSTFIDLLYDSGWEEGLPDRERWFAGFLNISPRKWRAIRDELIDLGKIDILPDGRLSDNLYRKERENAVNLSRTRRENGSSGGRTKAERAKKTNDINGDGLASGNDLPLYARARREEIELEKKKDSPTTSPETRAWDHIELADHLCRIAGVRNIDPSPIARNIAAVREWLDAGADPPLLAELVQAGRDAASNGIHSLKYFDAKVRRAIARRDHPNEQRTDHSAEQIRDPLLREYLQGH